MMSIKLKISYMLSSVTGTVSRMQKVSNTKWAKGFTDTQTRQQAHLKRCSVSSGPQRWQEVAPHTLQAATTPSEEQARGWDAEQAGLGGQGLPDAAASS